MADESFVSISVQSAKILSRKNVRLGRQSLLVREKNVKRILVKVL